MCIRDSREDVALRGEHNLENLLAAFTAVWGCLLYTSFIVLLILEVFKQINKTISGDGQRMQNDKAESYRSGKYQDKQTKEKPYHDNHRPPPRFRTVLNTKRKIITQTKIPKRTCRNHGRNSEKVAGGVDVYKRQEQKRRTGGGTGEAAGC